jgi:hypothetical protein
VTRGIGNLGSPAVQAELDPWLDGVELLILTVLRFRATADENKKARA